MNICSHQSNFSWSYLTSKSLHTFVAQANCNQWSLNTPVIGWHRNFTCLCKIMIFERVIAGTAWENTMRKHDFTRTSFGNSTTIFKINDNCYFGTPRRPQILKTNSPEKTLRSLILLYNIFDSERVPSAGNAPGKGGACERPMELRSCLTFGAHLQGVMPLAPRGAVRC